MGVGVDEDGGEGATGGLEVCFAGQYE